LEYAKKARREPKNHRNTGGSTEWQIVVRKKRMEMAEITIPYGNGDRGASRSRNVDRGMEKKSSDKLCDGDMMMQLV
jgi:hypothetical protein